MIEFWNPTPIAFYDLSQEEKILVHNEAKINNEKILLYTEANTWNDNVVTTYENLKNVFFSLNLKETFSVVNKYVLSFLYEWGEKHSDSKINKNISGFTIKESWYNFLPPNGFQGIHTHPKCFCSGVLFHDLDYIDDPGVPSLVFDFESNANFSNEPTDCCYYYIPGRIILFPSSAPHKVLFNKTNTTRKSISFNVDIF